MVENYDFCGWATRNDILCSDGRTIRKGAFKQNDGTRVPLCWNHDHNDPSNVLGHAILEERDTGVYAYCFLNDTDNGKNAKEMVKHKDVAALSIYANQLQQRGGDVMHGNIREVSLVLAGANPGAFIETVIEHCEDMDESANICFVMDDSISVKHSEDAVSNKNEDSKDSKEDKKMADNKEKTVKDVFDTLTEEQKNVVYALIGQAIEDAKNGNGGNENMKHNAFEDNDMVQDNVLSHADMEEILADGKRYGSLKESALQHGITNIDMLFPDAKNVTTTPEFIKRDMGWVQKVMNSTHHTPFSRIKSIFANITEDEARAKGYIKGNQKVDEVFGLLKRQTTPQTIYKKQKLDRDDVIDITDFDVVSWVKSEMRMMLEEEIARAILIGDGRSTSSNDKINPLNIRPIWQDNSLYTISVPVTVTSSMTDDARAKAAIRAIIKARKNYKGTGNPTAFMTEDMLTDMLLIEDTNGRVIYDTIDKLTTALRVKEIVTVEVMENQTRTSGNNTYTLGAIIVNLADYSVGADKGGSVSMFDDFDIDYNAQKYLIETRCSGALIKPYSAMAVEFVTTTAASSDAE